MSNSTCARCHQNVYLAERMTAAGKFWHKRCFKCATCLRPLDALGLSEHRGEIYCRACYSKYCTTCSPADIPVVGVQKNTETICGYSYSCEEKYREEIRKTPMVFKTVNGSPSLYQTNNDSASIDIVPTAATPAVRNIGFSHLPTMGIYKSDRYARRMSEEKHFSDFNAIHAAMDENSKLKSASTDVISVHKEIVIPVEFSESCKNQRSQIYIPINRSTINENKEEETLVSPKQISPKDGVLGLIKSTSQIVQPNIAKVKDDDENKQKSGRGAKDLVIGMTNMISSNWDSKEKFDSKTKL